MAILEILKFPDSKLRKKCVPIKEITKDFLQLANDMLQTMRSAKGIGLSAIQVNRFVRLLIADTQITIHNDNAQYKNQNNSEYNKLHKYESLISQPVILFNPEIIKTEGTVKFQEGCLSFPSYYAELTRFKLIEVQGLDLSGKMRKIKTDGLLSICIQHEIDHLNGKLFIDHLSPIKASRLRAQIKKHGYPDPNADFNQSSNVAVDKNDE